MRTQLLSLVVLVVVLSGCASVPVVATVSGNGSCRPAQDLPATKALEKAPEQDMLFEDFFGWVVLQRQKQAQDIRDYNSLYSLCVLGVGPGTAQPTH